MRLIREEGYREDINNVTWYIATEAPSRALPMRNEIERQVERLPTFPYSGREGRAEGTRELVVARTPFIVIYTVGDAIRLLRILHGAQQWPPMG